MIKYMDLELAFDFVNSAPPETNSAMINKKTGQLYYSSPNMDEDEYPADDECDDCVDIPHKNDLDLGRNLVFTFTEKYIPQHAAEIRQLFSRRGAYRNYKDFLDNIGQLDAWYHFESEQTELAIRQWCSENGLEIEG